MAGKKKKKDGKGKKDKDGGLPPPPNLEQTREGAAEALLTFQIRGKEEAVSMYEEEAESFKEKNHHQSERNYHLKQAQTEHYKTLVKGSHALQQDIDQSEPVERDTIDAVLKEKIHLERQFALDKADLESQIAQVSQECEVLSAELERWQHYKDKVRGQRSEYITEINNKMDRFAVDEKELKDELSVKLRRAKLEADQKLKSLENELMYQGAIHAMNKLDKDTRSEYMDNKWLQNQIAHMQKTMEVLRRETDAMERRNIQFITTVSEAQTRELQAMSDLYSMTTGRGLRSRQSGESGLPSVVDVTKCTTDKSAGGQTGRYELQLLSLKGSRPSFHTTPETVHLPPIEKQRSSHNALPPRTNWPISNTMLSTVLQGVE